MPDYRRLYVPGGTYFFTVALAERGGDLLVREIAPLRAAFRLTMAERPCRIDALVVLPDHLHCVWTMPPGDRDFSTRWGAIKSRFTRAVKGVGFNPTLQEVRGRVGFHPTRPYRSPSKIAKGDAGIWQRRFWEHLIGDEADFARHVEYCWINPAKHGLVTRVCDWPHSTFHREVRRGMVPADWGGAFPEGAFGEPVPVR